MAPIVLVSAILSLASNEGKSQIDEKFNMLEINQNPSGQLSDINVFMPILCINFKNCFLGTSHILDEVTHRGIPCCWMNGVATNI